MAERAGATPRRGCSQLRAQRITSIQVLDRSHQLPEGEACPVHQTAHEEAQSYVHAAGNVSLCPFTVSRRSSRSIRRRWEFFPIRCVSMSIKSHDPIHSVYLHTCRCGKHSFASQAVTKLKTHLQGGEALSVLTSHERTPAELIVPFSARFWLHAKCSTRGQRRRVSGHMQNLGRRKFNWSNRVALNIGGTTGTSEPW